MFPTCVHQGSEIAVVHEATVFDRLHIGVAAPVGYAGLEDDIDWRWKRMSPARR